jgi:hypothetical protein
MATVSIRLIIVIYKFSLNLLNLPYSTLNQSEIFFTASTVCLKCKQRHAFQITTLTFAIFYSCVSFELYMDAQTPSHIFPGKCRSLLSKLGGIIQLLGRCDDVKVTFHRQDAHQKCKASYPPRDVFN